MNIFVMNFTSALVDDRYLEILIVAQAAVAEVLRKLFAVRDGLQVAFKVDPDSISHRDAISHIEKEFLHRHTSNRFNNGRSLTRRDYGKRLAEIPRLGSNDRDGAFQ